MSRAYTNLVPAYPRRVSGRFTRKVCLGCACLRFMPDKWERCADCRVQELLLKEGA